MAVKSCFQILRWKFDDKDACILVKILTIISSVSAMVVKISQLFEFPKIRVYYTKSSVFRPHGRVLVVCS